MQYQRYRILGIYSLFLILLICTCFVAAEVMTGVSENIKDPNVKTTNDIAPELEWITTSMTDVVSGERISIKELAAEGKPVIVNTFAVWCPGCTMQLRETTNLQANAPDAYEVIGIDIDPNENADAVKRHVAKNMFAGKYTAAPREVTRSLVSAYGPTFALEVPQTILLCNNTAYYMGSGVFNEETMKEALTELCKSPEPGN